MEENSRRGSYLEAEMKGRRNKAFNIIKQELADKEKIKRKMLKLNKGKKSKKPIDQVFFGLTSINQYMLFYLIQGVGYVDAQRNMAVAMGERDVKADVKDKSR